MATAKDTDLPDLLEHLGYLVVTKSALLRFRLAAKTTSAPLILLLPLNPLRWASMGTLCRIGNYHTLREMDSTRIKNRRTWFRYSENRGGDAITFLQRFCDKNFQEAVTYLLGFNGGRSRDSPASYPRSAQREEKPVFSLPIANRDQRRVFAYLQKRGIAAQVIRAFLHSGLLYEDTEHHNCVFVGRDPSGKAVSASKRGTCDLNGAGFKGGIPGSDKETGFPLPCDPSLDWAFVFEAPIDLMSYLTLHRQVTSNAVALNCLYEGPLDTYLRENPHIRKIALCLDADGPGQEATEKFRAEYGQMGYAVSTRTPAWGKDWNAYLQQRGQAIERPAIKSQEG